MVFADYLGRRDGVMMRVLAVFDMMVMGGVQLGRQHGRFNKDISRLLHVLVCAKSLVIVFFFGRCIDPRTLPAVEWQFFAVIGHNILPDLRANRFDHVTEMSYQRKVVLDGVFSL
ncbi:hypothetical protein D3C86_1923410 [compost metagenome]